MLSNDRPDVAGTTGKLSLILPLPAGTCWTTGWWRSIGGLLEGQGGCTDRSRWSSPAPRPTGSARMGRHGTARGRSRIPERRLERAGPGGAVRRDRRSTDGAGRRATLRRGVAARRARARRRPAVPSWQWPCRRAVVPIASAGRSFKAAWGSRAAWSWARPTCSRACSRCGGRSGSGAAGAQRQRVQPGPGIAATPAVPLRQRARPGRRPISPATLPACRTCARSSTSSTDAMAASRD